MVQTENEAKVKSKLPPRILKHVHSPATFDQREIGVHFIRSINGHVQLRVSVQIGHRETVLQNQLTSLSGTREDREPHSKPEGLQYKNIGTFWSFEQQDEATLVLLRRKI